MATTRREFIRNGLVTGLAAAAVAVPALKALAQEGPGPRPGLGPDKGMGPDMRRRREYQHPQDPMHLTALEAKHWPKLRLSNNMRGGQPVDLMIQIGQQMHPMTPDHHIEWVEVWANNRCIMHTDFNEPTWEQPVLNIRMTPQRADMLTVRISCNLHGLWENNIRLRGRGDMPRPMHEGNRPPTSGY
jgi:superoxide reductase